jgi:hypothetical protein
MYTAEIISIITWPVLIWVSYRLVLIAIKKFEKKVARSGE